MSSWLLLWRVDEDDLYPQRVVIIPATQNRALYQIDIPERRQRLLAANASTISGPQWSSNGRYIIYTSFSSPLADVYLALPQRHYTRRITADVASRVYGCEQPSWAPDDRAIAYACGFSFVDLTGSYQHHYTLIIQDQPNWWRKDIQHTTFLRPQRTGLTTTVGFDGILWSPRGDWIAVGIRHHPLQIWLLRPNEPNTFYPLTLEGIPNQFIWSSDGKTIFYIDETTPTPTLHRYDVDTNQQKSWALEWLRGSSFIMLDESPVQDQLLLAANVRGLYVFEWDTARYYQLSDEIITEAQWSSDGRYILYHVDGGPLRLMPADG
ncbi:MAG: hypothetical protein CUN55_14860, partial [Phototrophicales bacterium]